VTRISFFVLLFAASAWAQDVAGAAALRDKASEHWNAGQYADGVKALKEAVALYVGVDPLPVKPWALTMRMLTWQQMKNGELDDARATFGSLVETLGKKPGLSGVPQDAIVAWRALREAAKAGKDFDKGIALYEEAIAAFDAAKDAALAAQVLHEAGNYSGQSGKLDRADAYLTRAAAKRLRIKDHLGYAWSSNQLTYWRTQASRYDDARAPLREAYRTMCERRLVVPQASIEANLRRILDELAQRPGRDDAAVREWLTELATQTSAFPRVIPRTHLIRTLLEWSLTGAEPLSTVRLVHESIGGLAPEERADVILQCAEMAILLKEPAQARAWLEGMKFQKDPLWAHLAARTHASAALAAKNAADLGTHANAALDLFDKLGDFGGARATAERLKAGAPYALDAALTARITAKLGAGAPGGAGGSASGSPAGDISKLDLHDPLFSIRMVGEGLVVEDATTERTQTYSVAWKPRNVGFNGLSLSLFGRYVVIRSLNYGRGAVATGAVGSTTMARLGPYWPLRDGYELKVLKNGAVRYTRMAEDNKGK